MKNDKFQNDWNKNSKWLLTKKARQKMCIRTGTKNLITVPKLYCNAEYWRLGIAMWMAKRQKYKPMQSIYNWMHGLEAKVQTTAKYTQSDAWARTGTKKCNVKTGQR